MGRHKPVKIRKWVDRDLFMIGVTIWACEGTRRRPYELEVSNSSDTIAKVFVQLLKKLGLAEDIRLRVHAPCNKHNKFEQHWREALGVDHFTKPTVTRGHMRDVGNGIIHIKIYSAIGRELFKYWTESLPQLLQIPKGRGFKSLPAHHNKISSRL